MKSHPRTDVKKGLGKGRAGARGLRYSLIALLTVSVIVPSVAVGTDQLLEGKVVTNNAPAEFGPGQAARFSRTIQRDPEPLPPADGDQAAEIEPLTPSQNIDEWESEIRIREVSRELTHGRGPTMRKPVEYNYLPNHTKVLIVGDSYVYGYSNDVQENVFHRQLEQMLNKARGGSYEVVTLGSDQASFLRQSDWVTPEKVAAIDPDVVILIHTLGRLQPSWMEEKYCKQFNTCIRDGQRRPMEDATGHTLDLANEKWKIIMCLRADRSPVSWMFRHVLYPYVPNVAEFLAVRYCNDERVERGFDLPTERTRYDDDISDHPYLGDLDEALAKIRTSVDGHKSPISTYVLNIPWNPEDMSPSTARFAHPSHVGPIFDLYAKYGFEEIPRLQSDRVLFEHRMWEIGDVQGESKGTVANTCVYDCEVSDELWAKNLQRYTDGLITHPMKYRPGNVMQFALAQDVAKVVLENHVPRTQGEIVEQPLVTEFTPAYLTVERNDPSYATVHHYLSNRELGKGNGFPWKGRWVAASCAKVNAPHAVIAVNRNVFDSNAPLKVGYHRGTRASLVFVFEARDREGNLVPVRTVRVEKGSSYTLTDTVGVNNVYVVDTSVTCADDEVVLEPFEVSLQVGTQAVTAAEGGASSLAGAR